MRVPSKLVFLGFAYEIVWRDPQGKTILNTYQLKQNLSTRPQQRTPHAMLTNAKGTALFVTPWKGVDVEELRGAQQNKFERMFEHWAQYEADLKMRFKIPRRAEQLKRIGQLLSVSYTSDKMETATDDKGRFNIYIHKFKKPPRFFANSRAKPLVWGAKKERGRIVTSRGLIG